MLGASKTSDKYIGSVHESLPNEKDNSSEIQGLPGRILDGLKEEDMPVLKFTAKEIVENYLKLYDRLTFIKKISGKIVSESK